LSRWFFPAYNPAGRFLIRLDEQGRPFGLKNIKVRQWSSAGDFNVNISLNKYGLRDRKDLAQSTPKDFFVVGNSFLFGWGVPEERRFSNLLEPLLGVEVYNIAFPGAGLNDLDLFINYAREKGANIKQLIIGVFMEWNIVLYSNQPLRGRFTMDQNTLKGPIDRAKIFLWNHSTLFNTLAFHYHSNPIIKKLGLATGNVHEKDSLIIKRTYSLPNIISTIERVKQITRGFEAIVLIIPSRSLWIGDNREVENRIHHDFVRLLQEQKFPVADPRPYFEHLGNPLNAYFKHDGHWNETGHRLVAQAIAGQIKQSWGQRTAPLP